MYWAQDCCGVLHISRKLVVHHHPAGPTGLLLSTGYPNDKQSWHRQQHRAHPQHTHPRISSSTWLAAAFMAGPFTAKCSCTVLLLRLGCDTTRIDSSKVPVAGS